MGHLQIKEIAGESVLTSDTLLDKSQKKRKREKERERNRVQTLRGLHQINQWRQQLSLFL